MWRSKTPRDDYLGLPGSSGSGRISQLLRGRWATARGAARIGFSFAIGLAVLIVGSATIAPAISAAEGHGTHGYFTARRFSCGRRQSCEWRGDFARTPGGPTLRTSIEFKGHLPSGVHEGTSVPAVDTGAPFEVFQPGNRTAWIGPLGLIVLGLFWLAVTAVVAWLRRAGRRSGVASPR